MENAIALISSMSQKLYNPTFVKVMAKALISTKITVETATTKMVRYKSSMTDKRITQV